MKTLAMLFSCSTQMLPRAAYRRKPFILCREQQSEYPACMPLAESTPIAFIPTKNPEASRAFYEHTLGLRFITDNDFAIVFMVGPEPQSMLRVVRSRDAAPPSHTVFGWMVKDVEQSVDQLVEKGIAMLRYGHFDQDARGIWDAPDGSRIAWFKDPDGNTLSVSQHP